MPFHSSTNFYKAEQEEFDRHRRERWVSFPYKRRHYLYYDDDYYKDKYYQPSYDCMCSIGEVCRNCINEKEPSCACCYRLKIDCKYSCKDSSCEICYDYTTTRDRIELIQDSFESDEILETIQTHLKEIYCWCYNRIENAIKRDRIIRHLRTRRSSSDVFIPDIYTPNYISPCVVRILDNQLGKEVHRLHQQRDLNERLALLEKYGLTLDDYKAYLEKEKEEVVVETKPQKPKQKFIKVKESTLQVGSF